MRIWHLLAAVTAIALAFALLRNAPILGTLVLLNVALVACAVPFVRFDRRVYNLWCRARRRSHQAGWLRGGFILVGSGLALLIYEAITALVITAAVVTVMATMAIALWLGAAALIESI
jgi:hypothetical protein